MPATPQSNKKWGAAAENARLRAEEDGELPTRLCKTMASGPATTVSGKRHNPTACAKQCHDATARDAQELLEVEMNEPLHLR